MSQLTRCYEYYVMFKRLPEKCEPAETSEKYVKQYMRFMDQKGVKFDGLPADKEAFIYAQDTFGSEGAVCRKTKVTNVTSIVRKTISETVVSQPQPEPLRCLFCGGTISDVQHFKLQLAVETLPNECGKVLEFLKQRPW